MKEIEHWQEAGSIAARVREDLKSRIEPGVSLLELCEEGEEQIKELGGRPAFPINIAPNQIAAHFTPTPHDSRKLQDGVVKIDVGVQKNGFIGDTAVTVPVGNPSKEVQNALNAIDVILDHTINGVEDGVPIKKISKRIRDKAHELGFGVVTDLNGHQIERGTLHAEITIPNTPSSFHTNRVKAGMILAIEPFIALGKKDGKTHSRRDILPIYALKEVSSAHDSFLRDVEERFGTLPFAVRWLVNGRSEEQVINKLTRLAGNGMVDIYPVLEETRGRMVIQKEHTVFVRENSAEILTKVA